MRLHTCAPTVRGEVYPVEEEEQETPFAGHGEPSEPEAAEPVAKPRASLSALLWGQTRARVMEAYRLYTENPERYADDLFRAVLDFATKKLYPLEYEFKTVGTADTVDDFAQEVAIEVWTTMGSRKRSPATFYAWLNRICFTTAKDAGKSLRRAVWEKEPLFLAGGNENPLVNRLPNFIYHGFVIPDWVKGTKLLICCGLLDGKDYRRIAWELHTTVAAIEQHVCRLKKEVLKRRGLEQPKNIF